MTKQYTFEKKPEQREEKRKPNKTWRAGSVNASLWTNENTTRDGTTFKIQSVKITRRYRDERTGEWKDSDQYRKHDLQALRVIVNAVEEYMLTNPIGGSEDE